MTSVLDHSTPAEDVPVGDLIGYYLENGRRCLEKECFGDALLAFEDARARLRRKPDPRLRTVLLYLGECYLAMADQALARKEAALEQRYVRKANGCLNQAVELEERDLSPERYNFALDLLMRLDVAEKRIASRPAASRANHPFAG